VVELLPRPFRHVIQQDRSAYNIMGHYHTNRVPIRRMAWILRLPIVEPSSAFVIALFTECVITWRRLFPRIDCGFRDSSLRYICVNTFGSLPWPLNGLPRFARFGCFHRGRIKVFNAPSPETARYIFARDRPRQIVASAYWRIRKYVNTFRVKRDAIAGESIGKESLSMIRACCIN